MPLSRLSRSAVFVLGLAGCSAAPMPPSGASPAGSGGVDEFLLPALPPAQPIPREEYARRRTALAERMEEGGVLVVIGAAEPAADYLPYAQASNFRYLTGVVEPGAALVVVKDGGAVRERIFVRARNPAREVWEGSRLGAEGVQRLTGIPARTVESLDPALDSLLAGPGALYTATPLASAEGLLETLTPEQQVLSRLARPTPNGSPSRSPTRWGACGR